MYISYMFIGVFGAKEFIFGVIFSLGVIMTNDHLGGH